MSKARAYPIKKLRGQLSVQLVPDKHTQVGAIPRPNCFYHISVLGKKRVAHLPSFHSPTQINGHTGVYLVVKQDEQSKRELLETLSLANDYNIHIEGWSRRASVEHGGLNKTPYEPVEVHISMYEASGLPYPPKGTKTALGVYINDRLVKEVPISLSNQKESYQEWRLTGEFDIPMQDVSTQTGDVVTFVALVADNYGRKASSVLSRYKILEGKELEYLAYDMLDLTGQTYGTEVWQ